MTAVNAMKAYASARTPLSAAVSSRGVEGHQKQRDGSPQQVAHAVDGRVSGQGRDSIRRHGHPFGVEGPTSISESGLRIDRQ